MIHTEYTKYYDTAYHRYRIYILLQYSVLYIHTDYTGYICTIQCIMHTDNTTYIQNGVSYIQTILGTYVQLGFPFAKLLRNFCGTKRKIFLSLRISFARKKNNLRNHSQKSFRENCPFPLLRNSSFAQFRNFVKLKRLVTVCVSKNSILDKSCFGMSSYNWSLLHN